MADTEIKLVNEAKLEIVVTRADGTIEHYDAEGKRIELTGEEDGSSTH